MDTTDVQRFERHLSELENYVLALDKQIGKLNSKERIIAEDTHCLIQFFSHLCDCLGVKRKKKEGLQQEIKQLY